MLLLMPSHLTRRADIARCTEVDVAVVIDAEFDIVNKAAVAAGHFVAL